MAWHYKQYQDDQSPGDRAAYGAAECAAMKAKLGLWRDPPSPLRSASQLKELPRIQLSACVSASTWSSCGAAGKLATSSRKSFRTCFSSAASPIQFEYLLGAYEPGLEVFYFAVQFASFNRRKCFLFEKFYGLQPVLRETQE